MKKLFIIILDFKGGEKLKHCLKSLAEAQTPIGWQKQVLLIDNNRINRGFSRGCNWGIKKALKQKAEAVLLLNQDTQVEKNFLIFLLANPADIVGPVIRFRHQGKWVYDSGGRVNWWLGRTKHLESSDVKNRDCGLDYISGCAMLIRRPVLEKIGLLEEKYFLYFEDVDFCLRAKQAGFSLAVEPKARITHFLKKGRQKPFWQRWQLLKSNLIFINHWIVWWRRPLAFGYWLYLSGRTLGK